MKIFLIGWFGAGNIGDEAILLSELLTIRSRIEGIRFYVLSFNHERTKRLTYDIPEVERIIGFGSKGRFFKSDFRGLLSAFKNVDAVIIGGGGIFQDLYNYYPVPFFTSMALLARLFRKQLLLHSVGIGPISHFISKILCRIAANSAHSISVRDPESRELLLEIGVNKEIHVSADPVFLLRSARNDKIEMLMDKQKMNNNGPVIGICVQNLLFWSQENKQALADALDVIAGEKNVRLVFLPFGVYQDDWFHQEKSEPVDIAASKELVGMLKSKHSIFTSYTTPEEIMAAIGRLDLIISMRLHGIIMGITMGVPVIALTYVNESKIRNLMKRAGREEDVFYVNNMNTEKLLTRIKNILSSNDEFKQDIREKAIYLKREAEKSIEVLSGRLSLSVQ
jgi:polysaccharide pyruvyl transferase CsaB